MEHGVPDRAARLYLTACRAGPQTASELARRSAVDRVEAYRLIEGLAAQGLLNATGARPRRFSAISPDQLVDRWIARHSDRLRRLERDRTRILADWESARAEPGDDGAQKFTVLDGRESIRRFLRKRIGTAEQRILVSATGGWLPAMIDGGLDRALRDARDRGVAVRLVTEVLPTNLTEAKHFAGIATLRHASATVSNRAVVLDRAGALVFVSGDDGFGGASEEPVALWSTSPEFVRLARDYHCRLWASGERAEARFVELEEPARALLPVVSGREAQPFQRLKEIAKLGMRASGVREFHLDLPELIDTIAHQLGREIAPEVEGQSPGEVAKSLARYYATHTMGRLTVDREKPLTLRVTGCFACMPESPEIGREMCPQLLRTIFEARLGHRWSVSRPDPTRHARHGCVFTAIPT